MAKKSTRLEAFHDLFKQNNITTSSIEGNETLIQKEGGYKKTAEPELGGTAIREYYIT